MRATTRRSGTPVHPEALDWVRRHATDEPVTVLDLGGRDNNGSPRQLFPAAEYRVLDLADGPDVDLVADAATWTPDREYDVVVCTEVFEHAPDWPAIVATAYKACRPGGRLVATMAGPGRPAHGAWGAGAPAPGEHYANIDPDVLRRVLEEAGWREVLIDQQRSPADVRAVATQ
jgi:SAM-dependent methyltransferase